MVIIGCVIFITNFVPLMETNIDAAVEQRHIVKPTAKTSACQNFNIAIIFAQPAVPRCVHCKNLCAVASACGWLGSANRLGRWQPTEPVGTTGSEAARLGKSGGGVATNVGGAATTSGTSTGTGTAGGDVTAAEVCCCCSPYIFNPAPTPAGAPGIKTIRSAAATSNSKIDCCASLDALRHLRQCLRRGSKSRRLELGALIPLAFVIKTIPTCPEP